VLVDRDATSVRDAITGANATDTHLAHVLHGRDFDGEVVDLRSVRDGDACPACGAPLSLYRGIERAHLPAGHPLHREDGGDLPRREGESRLLVMGCYGIGVSRLVATAIEQHHDEHGIRWPISIAPYQVHVVAVVPTRPSPRR
jgi:prolyl-tRNA synthetase